MASELFVTIRKAVIYNGDAKPRGEIDENILIICNDWVWETTELAGMRKILEGDWINKFIKDVDIVPVSTPPPPVDTAYVILYESDGTTRRFDEVIG